MFLFDRIKEDGLPIRLSFPLLDTVERRHDGPLLPADPAAPPQGATRERLFRWLAAGQRADIARRRLGLTGALVNWNEGLRRDQHRLRFYRDQGAKWKGAAEA